MIECEMRKKRVSREWWKRESGKIEREERVEERKREKKGKKRAIEKKRERVCEQLIYHSYILVLFL